MDNKEFNRTFNSQEIGILYACVKFSLDNNIFDYNSYDTEKLLNKIING